MGRYAMYGSGNSAASPGRSIAQVLGGTGVRPCIYEAIFSSDATPAEVAFLWKVMLCTTAGTFTSFTPRALDPTDPKAATATAGQNATTEPTVTANSEVLDLALNMRATFRWISAPDGEIRVPAAANNGYVFRCQHASSVSSVRATVHWFE